MLLLIYIKIGIDLSFRAELFLKIIKFPFLQQNLKPEVVRYIKNIRKGRLTIKSNENLEPDRQGSH